MEQTGQFSILEDIVRRISTETPTTGITRNELSRNYVGRISVDTFDEAGMPSVLSFESGEKYSIKLDSWQIDPKEDKMGWVKHLKKTAVDRMVNLMKLDISEADTLENQLAGNAIGGDNSNGTLWNAVVHDFTSNESNSNISLQKLSETNEGVSKEINDELKLIAEEQIGSWISGLIEQGTPFTLTRLRSEEMFGKDFQIYSLRVGNDFENSPEKWITVIRAAQFVKSLSTDFNLPITQSQLQIFELEDFSPTSTEDSALRNPLFGSILKGFLSLTYPNTIFVLPDGHIVSEDGEHFSLNRKQFDSLRVTKHEIVHFLDPYLQFASIPQGEGFARMIDSNCNFNFLLAGIIDRTKTKPNISRELLTIILKSDSHRVPGAIAYNHSGLFFCHLHERFGNEKFMRFYGYLTGGVGYLENMQVKTDAKGDVVKAMKLGFGITSDEDIDELFSSLSQRIDGFELFPSKRVD